MNKKLLVCVLITGAAFMGFKVPVVVAEISNFRMIQPDVYADGDLETIRTRIINDLLEPEVKQDEIKALIETQKPDGTWPGINYKDVSRTGFEHRIHLENMLTLSRAIRKTGSPYSGNQMAREALSRALNFWLKNDFICENWWWNEMGTPHLMINIMLLMDEDLSESQRTAGLKIAGRANLEAFGARS